MKKKFFMTGLLFAVLLCNAFAQDTLKMMQYNLMYYTTNSGVSDCNSVTNNIDAKDGYIETIFHHVMPDVFCVCEMGSSSSYADRLLNNAINTQGVDYYRHGPFTNYSGGYIANMLFYNSRKLTFYDHYYVTTSYRDINGYKMYYNSRELAQGDTVFMTFWIMHLKAGSSEANEVSRHLQTQRLMNKLVSLGAPGNNIVSGDFNIYGSSEAAYQEMVNYSNSLYRFYDPIDRPGNWNNNAQFADIHTQSTHTTNYDNGCFSSGGLDDRFDIILVSPYVYYGSDRVRVLPETYHALGQDGNRFNGSVLQPQNNSVPQNVAQALYNQSDHLPVITEFLVDAHVGVNPYSADYQLRVVNPVRGQLEVLLQTEEPDMYNFEIFSIDGKRVGAFEEALTAGAHTLHHAFPYAKGFYILKITNSKGQSRNVKLVR